jgi:proline iminopeptidase
MGLCDALGIEKPIVYGVSFGGFVAQAYATRHPEHPAKLILASTAARIDFNEIFAAFERVGGMEARLVAESYWRDPTPEGRKKFLEVCIPLYRARPARDPYLFKRAIVKDDVALWFSGPRNEHGRMDFRAALGSLRCPVLVMGGDRDPITPIAFSETIAASLPRHLVRFERFSDCGHGLVPDEPDRALAILREFILDTA